MKVDEKFSLDAGYWVLDTGCWVLDEGLHRRMMLIVKGPLGQVLGIC